MSKSDYLEDKIINHVLRNTAYTSPTTVYAALFTVTPSDTGGGTEVSGNGYARQSVAFDAPSPSGETQNTAAITFPTATGDWGTIVAWGLFDALTTGNLLYWSLLDADKLLTSGKSFKFDVGNIQINET